MDKLPAEVAYDPEARATYRQVIAGDTATTTDTGTDPFGAYPAGPYGNKVGDVVANLTWEGYVNPTGEAISNTLPYTTTSLQALRGNRRGYAMVHVSEFL